MAIIHSHYRLIEECTIFGTMRDNFDRLFITRNKVKLRQHYAILV
jgi:hypothetical protein